MRGAFAIAGVSLAFEADERSSAPLLRALAPFPAGDPAAAAATLSVTHGAPPDAGLHELTSTGGHLGWARLSPGRAEVWGTSEATPLAGLRLLLGRAFRPPGFLLVHGAAIAARGGAALALGPSGAGKSTFARLAEGAEVLSDELVLVEAGAEVRVHATPVQSTCGRPPRPGGAPLRLLLALEKAGAPALRPLPAADALALLLEQTFAHPEEGPAANLAGAARVVEAAERAVLAFALDPGFAPLVLARLASGVGSHT